ALVLARSELSHLDARSVQLVFFFSSRRRHTRFSRDWSSDVCSSDLRSRSGRFRAASSPLSAAREAEGPPTPSRSSASPAEWRVATCSRSPVARPRFGVAMPSLLVLDVVGLTPAHLGPSTPHLTALAREGFVAELRPVLPAVTCTVQS